MASDRKVVLVTRHTRLEELIARFQTAAQAKFYVEHLGADFLDYEREHATYGAARRTVEQALRRHCRVHSVDRAYLPSYLFAPDDVVVALGQDGLIANTLKYLSDQPLMGVNPDPERYDGLLLPFRPADVDIIMRDVLLDHRHHKVVTMAKATLSDGQSLYAVNDLFVGPKSHTSARYEIDIQGHKEIQSSSGLIVSTGLGSTAWMTSIVTGSLAIAGQLGANVSAARTLTAAWDAPYLTFAVREPFPSIATRATLVCGRTDEQHPLTVRSLMPENGIIFSDGIEKDFLEFNSGITATIRVAEKRGRLVV